MNNVYLHVYVVGVSFVSGEGNKYPLSLLISFHHYVS